MKDDLTTLSARLAYDKKHLWHPYSSMMTPGYIHEVSAASGVYLTLSDGRSIIDGMASWWAVIHGYNHPVLNQAAVSQIDSLAHVMFGGLTHAPAVTLSQQLIEITHPVLQHVFFSDSKSAVQEGCVSTSRLHQSENETATVAAVSVLLQMMIAYQKSIKCIVF